MNRHATLSVIDSCEKSFSFSKSLRDLGCGVSAGGPDMDQIKHRHYRRLVNVLRPGGDPLLVVSDTSPARQMIDELGYGPEWDDCMMRATSTPVAISQFLAIVRRDRDHDSDVYDDLLDIDRDQLAAASRSIDLFA